MKRLLRIDSSPTRPGSRTRAVADTFVQHWRAAQPHADVEHLDLWTTELPEFDAEMIEAKFAVLRRQDATDAQRQRWDKAMRLARQLNAADVVLVAAPVWNFGLPYRLKHYIDVVTLPEQNWRWTRERGYEPLLQGKAAVLVCSSANDYPAEGLHPPDFAKPHLRQWLRFIGIDEVHTINVAPTLDAPDPVAARLTASQDAAAASAGRL
ncbi:FMN-dependent NADH-azoreductase [Ideonella sp. BN130291]|uniref:FMN-dependent NADH-azoreductase n=1 Tax=Ideonella sp. BN130291 TaxID=3112940 RepID=UPI002E2688CC|nr:NAD(P)H-dependent oxidoreductase [Ideonella sp. BN130291]